MDEEHLSAEELLAIQRGETPESAALDHLLSCSACQRKLDDSRLVYLLRRSVHGPVHDGTVDMDAQFCGKLGSSAMDTLALEESESGDSGLHLAPHEIDAYRQSALPSNRVVAIERHLRACDRCLALYQRGRSIEQTANYPTTDRSLVDRARRSFRPGTSTWLGTVLLTGLDRGPTAILLPDKRLASGSELFAGDSPYVTPGRGAASRPPAPRPRALERATAARRVPEEPTVGSFPVTMDSAPDHGRGDRSDSEPLRVEAGSWELRFLPPSKPRAGTLTVQLVSRDRPAAAHGIRFVVRDPVGERTEATTDGSGRVRLPVLRGRSRVEVRVDPPLAFNIFSSD